MSIRTERVAQLVQQEVAQILQRDYVDRLQPMVTITDARMTPDLSTAYLYASVLGDKKEQRQATFRRLEELAPDVRETLASSIRHQLRTVPELKFFLDETHQRVERLDTLFDRIRAERAHRAADDEHGEDQPQNHEQS